MIPEKAAYILTLDGERQQSVSAPERESNARATLEAFAGRTLIDPEWDRVRARLLEFVSILRAWHQEDTISESKLRKAA